MCLSPHSPSTHDTNFLFHTHTKKGKKKSLSHQYFTHPVKIQPPFFCSLFHTFHVSLIISSHTRGRFTFWTTTPHPLTKPTHDHQKRDTGQKRTSPRAKRKLRPSLTGKKGRTKKGSPSKKERDVSFFSLFAPKRRSKRK